ncbi:hypothetical protein MCETE7_00933 [Acidimicrobiia bacterium]
MSSDQPLLPTSRLASRRRQRPILSALSAVVFSLIFTTSILSIWANNSIFDRNDFANRAVHLLDSETVRASLANRATDALIENGPSELASFRSIIEPTFFEMMKLRTFRDIFRDGVLKTHDAIFTQDGNTSAVNLSQTLSILTNSLMITNPAVANNLPANLDTLLVDFGNEIRSLQAWKWAENLSDASGQLLLLALGLLALTIYLAPNLQDALRKIGIAICGSGLVVIAVAYSIPRIAASYASTPDDARFAQAAVGRFFGDLTVIGFWVVGYGIAAIAFALATAPQKPALTPLDLWEKVRNRVGRWQPRTVSGLAFRASVVIVGGLFLLLQPTAVVDILVSLAGVYIVYLGCFQLLLAVAPAQRDPAASPGSKRLFRSPHLVRTASATFTIVAVISIVGFAFTGNTRARATVLETRRCNGHAELCDRTIDEVAFAGSHNSMSASMDPGWIFAENTFGIPAQLEYGIRALLIKTHYGVRTNIGIAGDGLVVTDRALEAKVNPAAVESQLPAGADPSILRSLNAAPIDPALRDIYLCHVYCEYGATRFSASLGAIRQFLTRNPDEVIIIVIGNYVSTEDTFKAFKEARLVDQLYEWDSSAPPPTLGNLIDQGRNIVMMSEYGGPPPGWNNPAYGLMQDTPFTFRTEAALLTPGAPGYTGTEPVNDLASCAPNRGTPESPLFQINHWTTPSGSASTIAQARIVNSYDVLMSRVRNCTTQRGKFATIVGVNFYNVGDLLKVVNDLNRVG